ncbi:MAG: hypothetical protein AB7O62_02445 [Pirellulales bacterium]
MRFRQFCRVGFCLGLSILAATTANADDPPSTAGPLMKLFLSGRLPVERQAAVVEMICNRGNEHDLRVVLDRVLQDDAFPPELRLKALGWLTDAAITRKVQPVGDLNGLEKLVSLDPAQGNSALPLAAIRLAATWKVAAISDELQALAKSAPPDSKMQRVALDGLVAIGDDACRATLKELSAPDQPVAVRARAVIGWASFDLPAAARAAAAVLADFSSRDEPGPLMDAFLNRKDGADRLAAAIGAADLSQDAAKIALRYMYSVGRSDAALSSVLGEAAGVAADAPPPTPEEIAALKEEVLSQGDAARGENVFRRRDLSCFKCHSLNRAGGQVGPDLAAVGGTSPPEYILNSILNPSLAVKEQYVTKLFEMNTGEVFTGIVIDRDDVRVNIKDAAGKKITLPTADIDDEVEGKSLMPTGLTKFLTHDDLLDLASFISQLGKPGPYSPPTIPAVRRWRYLADPSAELTEEVPHLELLRQHVFDAPPEAWLPAYSKYSGALPLDELRGGESAAVAYLQGEIEVTAAGRVAFDVASTEPTLVWIDGQPQLAQPRFELPLQPGRHKITLRVEISDRPSPELSVELSKPAESTVQFDVVGGA